VDSLNTILFIIDFTSYYRIALQISTGELVAEASSHNGTPPQMHGVSWCPGPLQPTYINKDLRGSCDVLCTIGVRHLKFWAFQRPISGKYLESPLLSRSHKMGKVDTFSKCVLWSCMVMLFTHRNELSLFLYFHRFL
jgi:hypothetical protein